MIFLILSIVSAALPLIAAKLVASTDLRWVLAAAWTFLIGSALSVPVHLMTGNTTFVLQSLVFVGLNINFVRVRTRILKDPSILNK